MLRTSLRLAFKRGRGHWFLLGTVLLGALLAVAIATGSIIYIDSLSNLALRNELRRYSPSDLDILIRAKQQPVSQEGHLKVISAVDDRIDRDIAMILAGRSYGFKSDGLYLSNGDATAVPAEDDRRRAFFAALPGLESHAELAAGRWPRPVALTAANTSLVVEAAIPAEAARKFRLTVGDRVAMNPTWQDVSPGITAEISGVFLRARPDDPFWRIYDEGFGVAISNLELIALIVTPETFISEIGAYFPEMAARYSWLLDVDPARINGFQGAQIQAALDSMQSELRNSLDGYQQISRLGDALDRFDTRLFVNRVPMLVVTALLLLAVLYYVVTLASLLTDARREEISLLRSRGAAGWQIGVIYTFEGIALAAIGVVLGPLLALGAVALVGIIPPFADLNGGKLLPVELTGQAYSVALVAGGISFLALLVPAAQAARVGLLQERRRAARPPSVSVVQKYYLDLMLLGLVLLLFWQLSKHGSFAAQRLFGEESVDQLILVMPALFMLAAGIVLLRIFPVTMGLLGRLLSSRVVSPITPPVVVLAIWVMARDPTHYARLSLLLILAAGLGVFAASFSATLDRSLDDRVRYEAGADFRAIGISSRGRAWTMGSQAALEAAAGVDAVTAVARAGGSFSSRGFIRTVTVLGIDPEQFPEVAWSRPDFTAGSFRDALAALNTSAPHGIPIPLDVEWLTARIRPLEVRADVILVARLSDARGRMYGLNLGPLFWDETGVSVSWRGAFPCTPLEDSKPPSWCRIGAPLDRLDAVSPAPKYPLRLEFIGVSQLALGTRPGALEIDDVAVAYEAGGPVVVLDGFGDVALRRTAGSSLGRYGADLEQALDVDGAVMPGVARLTWTAPNRNELHGVEIGPRSPAIPVLASPSFLDRSGYSAGDEAELFLGERKVVAKIVGIADYFPTLNPGESSYLITPIRDLWRVLSLDRRVADESVSEFWIQAGSDRITADQVRSVLTKRGRSRGIDLRMVMDRDALLSEARLDPLASVGWRALLATAFLVVLVVSALGFMVHAHVSFQARRGEFAVLRAGGLSMRQLLGLTLLEQLVVIGVAVGLGVFMGTRLGTTILPYLSTSGERLNLVPPLVIETDWSGFAVIMGITAVTFGVVITAILIMVRRQSIQAELRVAQR